MKSTEIRSQNVTLLFNILGSNREPDPYSSTAVAAAQVERRIGVPKGNSFFPISKEIALAGERYQLNDQEDRAMDRRYQLNGPKEQNSNKRYRLQDPEDIDGKYQLQDMNSAFLIHIPPSRNTMTRKRGIIRSCWFLHFTKCPRESSRPRSLPQEESSGFTDSMIIKQAVLQALGF